jgi:hypothetical protein
MNWRFAYSIGFHPWEDAAADPPFVAKAAELFAREQTGRQPPFGSALDLGTGSGIWGIEVTCQPRFASGGRLCTEGPAARPRPGPRGRR